MIDKHVGERVKRLLVCAYRWQAQRLTQAPLKIFYTKTGPSILQTFAKSEQLRELTRSIQPGRGIKNVHQRADTSPKRQNYPQPRCHSNPLALSSCQQASKTICFAAP